MKELLVDMRFITIGLVVIMAALWVASAILRRQMYSKMERLFITGEYDELIEMTEGRLAQWLFASYNLAYLRLNAYIAKGDDKHALEIFDDLLRRRLPKRQRTDLVLKAFSFYMERGAAKQTKALLDEIEGWDEKSAGIKSECRLMYDIVICKKTDYIDEMEEAFESTQGMKRGQLAYLLGLQYENKGDLAKRDEYMKQASSEVERQVSGHV